MNVYVLFVLYNNIIITHFFYFVEKTVVYLGKHISSSDIVLLFEISVNLSTYLC